MGDNLSRNEIMLINNSLNTEMRDFLASKKTELTKTEVNPPVQTIEKNLTEIRAEAIHYRVGQVENDPNNSDLFVNKTEETEKPKKKVSKKEKEEAELHQEKMAMIYKRREEHAKATIENQKYLKCKIQGMDGGKMTFKCTNHYEERFKRARQFSKTKKAENSNLLSENHNSVKKFEPQSTFEILQDIKCKVRARIGSASSSDTIKK